MAATSRKQFGAEEARGAHNPEVPGSKPGIAKCNVLYWILVFAFVYYHTLSTLI